MIQAEQEADQRAPVVRHHSHAVEFEHIEQRDHVSDQLLGGVPGSGRIGPARASQVRDYHPIALSQGRQHLVPPPPVLRKPVQQQQGFTAASLGDMHPQPGQLHESMLDIIEIRKPGLLGHELDPATPSSEAKYACAMCLASSDGTARTTF